MDYTHFDYKKVLSVLERLDQHVELQSEEAILLIKSLKKDENHTLPSVTELIDGSTFRDINHFCLISAIFFSPESGSPLLSFEMGESKCRFKFDGFMDEKDTKKFKSILPVALLDEGGGWREILAQFISKVVSVLEIENNQ